MIKLIKEAESYGWVVDDWKAQEAYDMFCDYIGKEEANEAIVRCLGNEELAACLAYLFRMYEFHELEESQEESEDDEEEFDEGCGRKSKKSKKSKKKSMKESKVTGNFHGLPDMKFVWHNTQSDPGVIYKGKYFNANEIDDSLWVSFEEYCSETGVVDDYDMFEQWVSENKDEVYDTVETMIEYGNYEDIDEVTGFGPFKGGWRSNGNFISGESVKRGKKKPVKESQSSSEAYYDFQEFLGKLEEFIDDNNILFSIKGTKFAGEGADTFEIILSSAYENEEVTTIILEHSNRNDYNAWTATYDFDGDYDDASATYIDDLYDDVTSWIERAAAVAG